MEEIVGSIYSDLGGQVLVTNYVGDRGIDALVHKDGKIFGVQVKRYRDSIDVSQIREFIGALVTNDLTRGVFVTTSNFRRGARALANEAYRKDIAIELLDGDALYAELRNAQRTVRRNETNWFPKPDDGHHILCKARMGPCSGSYDAYVWDYEEMQFEKIATGEAPVPRLMSRTVGADGTSQWRAT